MYCSIRHAGNILWRGAIKRLRHYRKNRNSRLRKPTCAGQRKALPLRAAGRTRLSPPAGRQGGRVPSELSEELGCGLGEEDVLVALPSVN